MNAASSRILSRTQVQTVLAKKNHRLDSELSAKLHNAVYILDDGAALLTFGIEDGRGRLYESRKALVDRFEAAEEQARLERRISQLAMLIPQGVDFPNQVPTLIDNLAVELRLDRNSLDGSEESLEKVDETLRTLPTERILSARIFAPLLAYTGEVIRRAVDGIWEMRLTSDGVTWEPWIVEANGRASAPSKLYKDLMEYDPVSVRAFVAGTLGARKLIGRPTSER